jgi:hypothetical protein
MKISRLSLTAATVLLAGVVVGSLPAQVLPAGSVDDATALRQRCYGFGLMHGDDRTDPAIIGIPAGICRDSYEAGRAYQQSVQRDARESLRQAEELQRAACADGRRLVDKAEREGNRALAQHLSMMIDCP